MHAADVAVVQLLVAHSASAIMAVTVASAGAKFMPVSVTMEETEATLYGDDSVSTGAASSTPIINKMNTTEIKSWCMCVGWQNTVESEHHRRRACNAHCNQSTIARDADAASADA